MYFFLKFQVQGTAPSPFFTPLGVFGAWILAPLALDVTVPPPQIEILATSLLHGVSRGIATGDI